MDSWMIGFGSADITPRGGRSSLEGQFETRITDVVAEPLEANCLWIQSEGSTSIWVSCDACHICQSLTDEVCARLSERVDGFRPEMLMLAATHIHTGPYHERGGWLTLTGVVGDDEGAMTAAEYRAQMAEGIVEAVKAAREDLRPRRVEIAIAPVITGVSRRVVYRDGTAKMYGELDPEHFYRMEARDGGPMQLMYVYDADGGALRGVVADVPCTAQCDEHADYITSDYWGVVRRRLRGVWGDGVALVPLVRAAGDLSPHAMIDRYPGEARTGEPMSRTMGNRVADAIEWFRSRPLWRLEGRCHRHASEIVELPVWPVSEAEYRAAKAYMADGGNYRADGSAKDPFAHANAWTRVHRVERDPKTVAVRVNATRLDGVALVSLPFEMYVGYADRIRVHFPQALIFDVELTSENLGYLPTREAIAGGHYSANIFNGVCDADGGDVFVDKCVGVIRSLFED